MTYFLQFLGFRPIKFLRLIPTLLLIACVALVAAYFLSPSAQYGVAIISNSQRVNAVSFNKCLDQEVQTCVQQIIEKNKVNDFMGASSLIDKVEKFYEKQQSIIKKEAALVAANLSINAILNNMNLKQHYILTEITPLFGIFKKDLCIIKSGEKDIEMNILMKLIEKSMKERQSTYEKYPSNQELIHIFVRRQEITNKLLSEMEEVFPKNELAKCAKSYALRLKKIESSNKKE